MLAHWKSIVADALRRYRRERRHQQDGREFLDWLEERQARLRAAGIIM